MVIRLSRWGLALLAASSLSSISPAWAQDTDAPAEPTAPAAAPSNESPEDAAHRANQAKEAEIQERALSRNRYRENRPRKVHDADPWKKHPPIWSVRDETKAVHPYAHPSAPAPGIGHFPGGPTGQFGYPYYYTATSPDTAYGPYGAANGLMPGIPPSVGGGGPGDGHPPLGPGHGGGFRGGYGPGDGGGYAPGFGGGYGLGSGSGYGGGYGMGYGGYGPSAGYGPGYGGGYGPGYGTGFGGPGYGPIPGFTVAAFPGQLPGNPYLYHFGPGFYRFQEAGHYRFPYYSYRRPWYFHGHPSYNRDTNIPW